MSTNLKKYKIVGEYLPYGGTQIIDQDTGQPVRQVRKVVWTHEAGKLPTCVVELVGVEIAAVGHDISSIDQTDPYRRFKSSSSGTELERRSSWCAVKWKALLHFFGL